MTLLLWIDSESRISIQNLRISTFITSGMYCSTHTHTLQGVKYHMTAAEAQSLLFLLHNFKRFQWADNNILYMITVVTIKLIIAL